MIASHYAEPLVRHLAKDTALLADRSDDSAPVADLTAGDLFHMLDCSRDWAWGYADKDHRVGYVRFEMLKP